MPGRCNICGRDGIPDQYLGDRHDGVPCCLRCWIATTDGPTVEEPGPPPSRPPDPPPSARQVLVSSLEARGLPVAYGVPGLVGTFCPLCPPRPGPASGDVLIGIPMTIEFSTNNSGVRFHCANGCPPADIRHALEA